MLNSLIDRYCRLLSAAMVICLVVMVAMVFGNVVLRYAFNSGIAVSEELSRWLFVWVIFLGATVAVRERAHMGTDLVVAKLPLPAQKVVVIVGKALMLWVTWLMFSGTLEQAKLNWDVEAPVTGYSMAWIHIGCLVFAVSSGVLHLLDFVNLLLGKLTPAQILNQHEASEAAEAEAEAGIPMHAQDR